MIIYIKLLLKITSLFWIEKIVWPGIVILMCYKTKKVRKILYQDLSNP